MRDSPSLEIVPALQRAGAAIRAFDPEGMDEARHMLNGITLCDDAYQAMEGADGLVLVTEWNAFRNLDLDRMKRLMAAPVVVDLRNIYDPEEMRRAGFAYHCIGRPKA
jgi:UDPglucose 6-dehydrogenase